MENTQKTEKQAIGMYEHNNNYFLSHNFLVFDVYQSLLQCSLIVMKAILFIISQSNLFLEPASTEHIKSVPGTNQY